MRRGRPRRVPSRHERRRPASRSGPRPRTTRSGSPPLLTDEGYPAGPRTSQRRIERFAAPGIAGARRGGRRARCIGLHRLRARARGSRPTTGSSGSSTLIVDPGVARAGDRPRRCSPRSSASARDEGVAFLEVTAGHHRPDARASCSRSVGYDASLTRTSASGPDGRSSPAIRADDLPPAPAPRRGRGLLDLPWELPLADWQATGHAFRELPVGPSRHLVRFLVADGIVYALKELPERRRRDASSRSCATSRRQALPAVRAVGLAERAGARRRDPRHRVPRATRMQYRRLLMRLPPGLAGVPRPAAGRDGAAAGRPPSRRRLLGRLLARQHAVPPRRRPDPGLPRRCRDVRGPPVAVRRPAPVRPRHPRRERRLRPRRPRRATRAGRTTSTPPSTPPSPSATRYEAVWGELYDQPDLIPGDRQRDPGPAAAAQRPRLLGGPRGRPGGRAGSVRIADLGDDPPLPRQRARAADAAADARGAGPDPAQRPRRVPRLARVLRAPRRPARGGRRSAGCARSTGRRSRGSPGSSARTATSSRPTATSSSTSGCCPSAAGATSGCERRSSRTSPRARRPRSGRMPGATARSTRSTWRPTTRTGRRRLELAARAGARASASASQRSRWTDVVHAAGGRRASGGAVSSDGSAG